MILPSLVTLRSTNHVDGNKLCYTTKSLCYLTRYYFINNISILPLCMYDFLKISTRAANELNQRLISILFFIKKLYFILEEYRKTQYVFIK